MHSTGYVLAGYLPWIPDGFKKSPQSKSQIKSVRAGEIMPSQTCFAVCTTLKQQDEEEAEQ